MERGENVIYFYEVIWLYFFSCRCIDRILFFGMFLDGLDGIKVRILLDFWGSSFFEDIVLE